MFDFNESLNQIEKNLDEAIGAYFVYDNIMLKAYKDEKFLERLNQNLYFWHYIIHSLQTTYFMCLGRIFDNSGKALSINAFINKCTQNIKIFSKPELTKRKVGIFESSQELQNYIDNSIEPKLEDFKELKRIIKSYSKEYEDNYKNIRHKIFGHTEITKKEEIEKLFLNTSRIKIEEILLMLKHITIRLFSLYHNGQKIELFNDINSNSFHIYKKIKEEADNVLQKY